MQSEASSQNFLRRLWSNPSHRFVLSFGLYLTIVALGYPLLRDHWSSGIQWLIQATARIEYAVLQAFAEEVRIYERTVQFGTFRVKIIEECTAIYEVLIFSAAVLAFPTTWRKKAIGIGFGALLLYLINLIRIAVLVVVGRYRPDLFDFMHLYFWQATLILMITAVWLLWIFKVVRGEQTDAAAAR